MTASTASTASEPNAPAPRGVHIDWLSLGIACFSLLIVAALWVRNEFLIQSTREQRVADVMRSNANLARTFTEHAISTFGYLEEILLLMKKQYEKEGARFDLPRFYKEMRINPTIIRNIVITDETGMVILGSHGAPHVSLADREHIKVHFNEKTDQIYIGKPVLARINKEWSIVMTRRANKPDGSLAGVLAIAVSPFYFSDFYRDLDLGEKGTVAFVGFDGVIRARLGNNFIGTDLSMSEVLRQAKLAPAGSFIAKSVADGVFRIYSYRTLPDYLLIVNVGTSLVESLADVEERAHFVRIAEALVTLIIAALSAALIVFGRRLQRAAVIARSELLLKDTNEILRQKAAELDRVNKELEAFSYSVSHDLRAPLRHIGGFSNLLLKENYDGLDAKGRERLDRIIAASTRMGTLIDDLLNLSRIARQPLSVKAVDLSAMAGEISDALVRENPQRSVEIDIAPGLTIQADHGLMRIVMTNLIENAWKYSANSAHARIEIGATSRDGETVYYVRDNGAGFDMKYSDKLFSPFQRLHSEAEFAGTGVGLATVKRIIERHQGKVWIEGAVDHGATVYFSIGNPDIVQAGTLKGPGD